MTGTIHGKGHGKFGRHPLTMGLPKVPERFPRSHSIWNTGTLVYPPTCLQVAAQRLDYGSPLTAFVLPGRALRNSTLHQASNARSPGLPSGVG